MIALVEAAEDGDLDQPAGRPHRQGGGQDSAGESERARKRAQEGDGQERPQHVEAPVGHVDQPKRAEDQGQPGADQEQERRPREPGDQDDDEGVERHAGGRRLRPSVRL